MKKISQDLTQFHTVDQTPDPKSFVKFMDTSHALENPQQSYQQEMIRQMAIHEGATVLDVGCGTGRDTLSLAQLVGPGGQVIGIDKSETMLQEARTRATEAQLPVEYLLADATQLPFADATFDGCQAARVFNHLSEPELALTEMLRVTRPGGRIVLADSDFDLLVVETSERALARKIIHAACDQMAQGWIGRQLPRFFQQAGLHQIWIDTRMMQLDYAFFQMAFRGILQRALTAGAISEDEHTRFWQELAQAEQNQHFFAGAIGFIISGQKPR